MRAIKELNVNERGEPLTRRSPTRSEIKSLESLVGTKVPETYLAFLSEANGGHPELSCFVPEGSPPSDTWEVNRFYHLGDLEPLSEEVRKVFQSWKSIVGPARLPIAADSGGNQILLDFTALPPGIAVWIHDEKRLKSVAPSFEAFLDKLSANPDFI